MSGRGPLPGRKPRSRNALSRAVREVIEANFTPEQRLLILDSWRRSGLPAGDFAPLVGVSKHTLYAWKKRFEAEGPAGLLDRPKGTAPGSRLPDITRRTILMLKESHPDWGCQRISEGRSSGFSTARTPAEMTAAKRTRVVKRRTAERWFTDFLD